MIRSAALILDFICERAAHDVIRAAIEQGLTRGPRTPDVVCNASTTAMRQAIAVLV